MLILILKLISLNGSNNSLQNLNKSLNKSTSTNKKFVSTNSITQVKIPEQGSNINVICWFRPINKSELQKTTKNCIEFISSNQLLISSDPILSFKQTFIFVKIFDEDVDLEDIYNASNVYDVLKGYNGTVLCYGQTGSGKTYTIGQLYPRVIKEIFSYIKFNSQELIKVQISYLEIYMERINDLINPKNKKI